jgi:choline dehydrogenase-like flavoprotein
MNAKKILAVAGALVHGIGLSGCSALMPRVIYQPMPDDLYEYFARLDAAVTLCMKQGDVSPELVGHTRASIQYSLNTWEVNYQKLQSTVERTNREAPKSATADQCKIIAAEAHEKIARSRIHAVKGSEPQPTITPIQIQRPIFCNRIGTTTICN